MSRETRSAHESGALFQSSIITIGTHAYTHVDAPVHFLRGGRHIGEMPIDQWVGDAAVVDLTHLEENAAVTAAELDDRAGHVRPGDIVLLWTDWPRRCDVGSERFWRSAPYTAADACHWLVARGAKAVGYDYPPDYCVRTLIFQPDLPVSRQDCTTHDIFFPADVAVVEYLTNLHQIGASRCRFVALPLAVEGADGSPVRAVAFVDAD